MTTTETITAIRAALAEIRYLAAAGIELKEKG